MFNEDSIMTYNDFNTIEQRIVTLRTQIVNLGFTVESYTAKNWLSKDFLLYTYLNNIETGIGNLGSAYFKPYGWQDKKTWSVGMSFSYKDVNRWWNNLNLIQSEIIKHTENLKFNNNVYFDNTTIFG